MSQTISIQVLFHSYCREITGIDSTVMEIEDGLTIKELTELIMKTYPVLSPMKRSMLTAVGLDYLPKDYRLKDGDEVSFFPPVQGG